jgi:hypothetical protein
MRDGVLRYAGDPHCHYWLELISIISDTMKPSVRADLFYIGLTQTTGSDPFVGHFSPRRAKNDLHKEEKYHAAAG